MLKLLSSVSPIAVLLLGAVPAGAVGWFAHGVKFDLLDRPAIVREATNRADDAAAIRVMDAANRAEAAERERQRAAGAEALRIYREALSASERATADANDRLEKEIAAHAEQMALEGRPDGFAPGDIDWLYNHRAPPAGAGR